MIPGDWALPAALLCALVSFTLSASAGLGGSLLLVPALALLYGPKEGVALAAALLAANNVWKVALYRRTVPLRASLVVVGLTMVGAFVGAHALLAVPEGVVAIAVAVTIPAGFLFERGRAWRARRAASPWLAFLAGATSGFSGTSGPLKGLAIRGLGFDRLHFVGAASVVSLGGDLVKTSVFASGQLFAGSEWLLLVAAIPLMALGSLTGRRINREIGEPAFLTLFWVVMTGYAARLLVV